MYLEHITILGSRHNYRRYRYNEIGPTCSGELSQELTVRIGLVKFRIIKDMVQRLEIRSNDHGRLEI